MAARIVSDVEFKELKTRIIKDKIETLSKGGTTRTVRNRLFGRMTALAGTNEERAYTESQLDELFEIMG